MTIYFSSTLIIIHNRKEINPFNNSINIVTNKDLSYGQIIYLLQNREILIWFFIQMLIVQVGIFGWYGHQIIFYFFFYLLILIIWKFRISLASQLEEEKYK